MEQQAFQILSGVFAILMSIIGALVMLAVSTLKRTLEGHDTRHENLKAQVTQIALDVAKNYMPRDELDKKLDAIFSLLEDIRKEVRHA